MSSEYRESAVHTRRLAGLAAALLLAASALAAPAGEYLFDVLKKPAYLSAWNALFAGEKDVDAWLAAYAKTKDGPATPAETVPVGGVKHQVNFVCKAHDCGDNRFTVIFAPGGTKAWGLLLRKDRKERFFGDPGDAARTALRAAARR